MAAADGLAGLIGRALQTPQWQLWGQTKSIAGTLTMAVVSLGVLGGLASFSPHHPDATGLVMISLLAVGLEQVSKWGIDNLSVPIGVALSWQWLSG
jgi:phytol kinase